VKAVETRRRVTASDVARAAGVSKTTVSYVLNDAPDQSIPEQTRTRVLEAARRLSYSPLSAARALRRGHTDTVLLVLPDWPLSRALSLIIESLTEELERDGLSLVTRKHKPSRPLLDMVREMAPAAVISLSELENSEVADIRKGGTFVAAALLTSPDSLLDTVVVPQALIGAWQVQHLAAQGHRQLTYVALKDPRVSSCRDLRLDGARRACLDLDLDMPTVADIDLTLESAATLVRKWRRSRPRPTGVLAYNDEVAVAVLAGMRSLGLSAPGDFAVIGVDNEPLSQFAVPPLTTIDQRHGVIARHLADIVTYGVAGKTPPQAPRSEALTLIVRESA
jgi:DNA-binding LacI/PurR family transcriptional regulator